MMTELSADLIKIEVVHQLDAAREGNDDLEMVMASNSRRLQRRKRNETITHKNNTRTMNKFGIRATFAQHYQTRFGIRMKVTIHGRVGGEKLIENGRIHDVEGHTVFQASDTSDSGKDSHLSGTKTGQSIYRCT